MENFNPVFTLLAKHENITLNTDILETGLLNIFALLAILVYAGKDFLKSLLEERKRTILKSIQDAENRLTEATKRLTEAKNQLGQTAFVINEIKNETIKTKKLLLQTEVIQAKKDLKIRFDRALTSFRSKERQIFIEIKQQIITVVFQKSVKQVKQNFESKELATTLINETISKIDGDLL